MRGKVKVSRDIAEAIEDVRSSSYTDFEIIRDIVEDKGKSVYGTKMPVLIKFAKYSSENQQTLILALVNGYEVEKTEQEKVIAHFKSHLEISQNYSAEKKGTLDICEIEQERYSSGFVAGITEFAKAYGIKLTIND